MERTVDQIRSDEYFEQLGRMYQMIGYIQGVLSHETEAKEIRERINEEISRTKQDCLKIRKGEK